MIKTGATRLGTSSSVEILKGYMQDECEVPFKPTESKPVYCRECYIFLKANKNKKTRLWWKIENC